MDLFFSIILFWPIKTISCFFPFVIVIYCAHKEGYKKALILLLSMVVTASFSWVRQWDLMIFLEQVSVFLMVALILVLDLLVEKKSKIKKEEVDSKKESEDDTLY